jgi:hypothetical protein
MGGGYGWLSGWVAICAYCAANTTIAYLGAPWALTLAGITPTPNAIVVTGMVLVAVCAVVGGSSVDVLGRVIKAASPRDRRPVGIGLASAVPHAGRLDPDETLGAEAPRVGRSEPDARCWLSGLGVHRLDAWVGASEETRRRRVRPRRSDRT